MGPSERGKKWTPEAATGPHQQLIPQVLLVVVG